MSKITMPSIGIMTSGLWRHRKEIEIISNAKTLRLYHLIFNFSFYKKIDYLAGWGFKPTSNLPRKIASKNNIPYYTIEEGLIRSLRIGRDDKTISYVFDKSGIYYSVLTPCDLDEHIKSVYEDEDILKRAHCAIDLIKKYKISKYNDHERAKLKSYISGFDGQKKYILVVDQTRNDASITYAGASPSSFYKMLDKAIEDNKDCEIIIKTHPDTLDNRLFRKRKYGHFSLNKIKKFSKTSDKFIKLYNRGKIHFLKAKINPYDIFPHCEKVYTVTSQVGFEALMAGKQVHSFGMSFYAGRGLSIDYLPAPKWRKKITLEALFAAFYFKYTHYFDIWKRSPIEFEEALEQLHFLKSDYQKHNKAAICFGFSLNKRIVLRRFIYNKLSTSYREDRTIEKALINNLTIYAWSSKISDDFKLRCQALGIEHYLVEDGFIRSFGLGAKGVRAGSLSFDRGGIYYDPFSNSDLFNILENYKFDDELIERAKSLKKIIISKRLTKYNLTESEKLEINTDKEIILIPGQVEDDAAIRKSRVGLLTKAREMETSINLVLMKSVRKYNPSSYIIYKEHPDVSTGYRKGKVSRNEALKYVDQFVSHVDIIDLIEIANRIETITSLTGFEALIRGKNVTTYAKPFYSGFGLTDDKQNSEPNKENKENKENQSSNKSIHEIKHKNKRKLSINELIAGSLILYPRYWDKASKKICPPEIYLNNMK